MTKCFLIYEYIYMKNLAKSQKLQIICIENNKHVKSSLFGSLWIQRNISTQQEFGKMTPRLE